MPGIWYILTTFEDLYQPVKEWWSFAVSYTILPEEYIALVDQILTFVIELFEIVTFDIRPFEILAFDIGFEIHTSKCLEILTLKTDILTLAFLKF